MPLTTAELKRQFGLAADPRKPDIVPATGNFPKLVRTVTPGGHGVDSSQPGFPVYHRHVANPIPLGALSVGASLLIFGLTLIHAKSMKTTTIFYTVGLPFGGIGSTIAGFWFYPQGSTFGTTLFGILGGTLISFCMADLPWTAIQATYVGSANSLLEGVVDLQQALGLLIFVAFILIMMFLFAAMKTSMPMFNAIVIINIALILYGVSLIQASDTLAVASGALFVVVGILLYYTAASVLLADEGLHFLPVFPLPHVDS
ncbi:hypothetical protein RQP46_010113 [Phenoliferia psychrophenolica]